MASYTFYIVSRSANDHYPVLIANNGKIPFNESVKRANKLEASIKNFLYSCYQEERGQIIEPDYKNMHVAIVRITHAEFKKKFPHYAKNVGRKSNAKGK
jgi:hypothetical protein